MSLSVQEAIASYQAEQQRRIMTPFHAMVETKVMERVAYKLVKDWKRADAIRDELRSFGFDLEEHKFDTLITIPKANYSWWITTDLARLAKEAGEMSGFVPSKLSPELLAEEAEWYRQKAEREANESQ